MTLNNSLNVDADFEPPLHLNQPVGMELPAYIMMVPGGTPWVARETTCAERAYGTEWMG